MIFLIIDYLNHVMYIGCSRIFTLPLNFYEASRFIPPQRMDAPANRTTTACEQSQ